MAWEENGIRFGYPACCIEAFCSLSPRVANYDLFPEGYNRSGFIPCTKCRQKILRGETTLEGLIDYKTRDPKEGRFIPCWSKI